MTNGLINFENWTKCWVLNGRTKFCISKKPDHTTNPLADLCVCPVLYGLPLKIWTLKCLDFGCLCLRCVRYLEHHGITTLSPQKQHNWNNKTDLQPFKTCGQVHYFGGGERVQSPFGGKALQTDKQKRDSILDALFWIK